MAQYSLEWVLEQLLVRGLIDEAMRRDIEVRAPAQRARVVRAQPQSGQARYRVGAGELIASFELQSLDDNPITEDTIAEIVAEGAKLEYLKIDPLELDMGLIARTLSRPFAQRHVVMPIKEEDGTITVAVENPHDFELVENLRRLIRGQMTMVVSAKQDILKCIAEVYGFRKSIESAAKQHSTDNLNNFEQLVKLRSVGELEASDQHVVNAVDFLLRYAFDQRGSDIHIEPRKDDSQVRLRIDGVLHNVHKFPRNVHPAITSRLKTLARMDIAEKRRPQDGRIKTVLAQKEVELRVSTMPVAFGEKIVIRIFDPFASLNDLADLGFVGEELAVFQRWIGQPHGLFLITGPTGSGKTTTLYTALEELADDAKNITTIEDPIEMVTDRFNQVAVQHKIGVDFASAMRTILRQDPDIIMVGEIRDGATAEMAVQAALTGHLVLSTLHTNDAPSAVTRLLDLGLPPFLISSTLIGVMAQRLVRRVCRDCAQPAPLAADQLLSLGIWEGDHARFAQTQSGEGCVSCRNTGYYGRVGIFEMMDMTERLKGLILDGASEEKIRLAAHSQGMQGLRECALDRLANGLTTPEEVVRVTGSVRERLAAVDDDAAENEDPLAALNL